MAPKKKTTTMIGSSGPELPSPVRASSGPVAERTRGAAREHPHRPGSPGPAGGVVCMTGDEPRGADPRDGVGPPTGSAGPSRGIVMPPTDGVVTSKTPTPAPTARSSQIVRDEQCRPAADPGRRPGKSPCILRWMREASVHAETPTRVADDCGAVVRLLLTWLEVEAHRGPPSSRRRPCPQKP